MLESPKTAGLVVELVVVLAAVGARGPVLVGIPLGAHGTVMQVVMQRVERGPGAHWSHRTYLVQVLGLALVLVPARAWEPATQGPLPQLKMLARKPWASFGFSSMERTRVWRLRV